MKKTTIKIDRNIPIPKKTPKSKYPIGKMKVGDSFLAKTSKSNLYFLTKYFNASTENNWKFLFREERNGIRAWRIK